MWSAQAALALPNYQNIIMRQNSVNSNAQQEASSSFNNSNQNEYPFQGMAVGGFQQRPMLQAPQSHQQAPHSGSHAIQQHMIQELLQDMSNGVGGQKPLVSRQSAACGSMSMGKEGLRYGISSSATSPLPPVVPTRSKGASHSDSSAGNAGVGNPKAATTNLPNVCDDRFWI
ncbi:hypothetical protein Hanom_Chr16g01523511 [Helianthus anomalus]